MKCPSSRYDSVKMKTEGLDVKIIVDSPIISNGQYREAHKWTVDENLIIVEIKTCENFRCFLTPTNKFIAKNDALTAEDVDSLYKKNFESFEDYKVNGHKMIYETKICLSNCLLNSTCTCGEFRDNFMCKHIIGFSLQLKLKACPKEGNSKAIAPKPKPGRIPKAKKALQRQ